MISYQHSDLTQHPPRSPRIRLGGYVHLPRLLDKARAHLAGKLGEYNWNCPLDQRFLTFTGLNADALLAEVRAGRNDSEILAWVTATQQQARSPWEILAWSDWLEHLAPGDAKRHAAFSESIAKLAPRREDIQTAFDRLDLDDYASFGGRP
ncbi:MAG: DUF5069 domain-containing protein [Opitutales bacterium]